MTRIGRKTLWLMVFIGFIAALVVFFAVATSGFKNWNGNEWFDYWGQGKPVTTTVSNDKDKPVAQNAMRLNNPRAVNSTTGRVLIKTQSQNASRWNPNCGQLHPNSLLKNPPTFDEREYIFTFAPSNLSQYVGGMYSFSLGFSNISTSNLSFTVSFENSKLRAVFSDPSQYSPTTSDIIYEVEKTVDDSSINRLYITLTDMRFFVSYLSAGEGENYEKSKNFILLDFKSSDTNLNPSFGRISNYFFADTLYLSYNNLSDGSTTEFDDDTVVSMVTETMNYYSYMEIPEKEGYTFTGWYYDEACTRPYHGEPITQDTNLYAGFEINKYTVTFDLREVCDMDDPNAGDTYFHTIEVEHGQTASYTPAPVEGKTFVGWFTVDGTKYENTPIKQDTELIGHWSNICYTITFNVNGGDNDIAPMTVEHGTVAELPTPVRTGYAFLGWICSTNPDYSSLAPVTSDLRLTATWERNVFTVTFYVDNTVFKTIQVEYGQTLGSATTDSGISTALVVGFENVNTTTASATINDFEVIDDVVVYLSDTPDIPDVPDNKDKPTDKSDNQVVRFLSKNWILLTVCIVGGIILILIFAAAFKRKKH